MKRQVQLGLAMLLALGATALLAAQGNWWHRAALATQQLEAYTLVRVGVDWAREFLSDERRASRIDQLGEPWVLRVPAPRVDDAELVGHITDQQGVFNLNNVFRDGAPSARHLAQFRRLLLILGLPDTLADAYLANGRPLTDAAELAQLPGFDAATRARLAPFVTTLPRFTALNVNSASPEVLAAVMSGLELDDARALSLVRAHVQFRNVGQFLLRVPPGASADSYDMTTESQYFMASVRATIGEGRASGAALLMLESTGWPAVVWKKYS